MARLLKVSVLCILVLTSVGSADGSTIETLFLILVHSRERGRWVGCHYNYGGGTTALISWMLWSPIH